MLSFKNRLSKKDEFERVLSKGRSVLSHPVFLKFRENNLAINRFGVSVGLKFSKKAVERNMVKRKIRAFLRENMDYFNFGFDVIIIPRGVQNKKDFDWRDSLQKAFEKANLINVKEK